MCSLKKSKNDSKLLSQKKRRGNIRNIQILGFEYLIIKLMNIQSK
jgi:hypothetical protein